MKSSACIQWGRSFLFSSLCFVPGVLLADSVFAEKRIHPGNGIASNVTESLSGPLDLFLNPGSSGGGLISLNQNNSYFGSTTLGCGTLILNHSFLKHSPSEIGAGDRLVLGPGTLRFDGVDEGVSDRHISHRLTGRETIVYDVRNDLHLTGSFVHSKGCLVKTGPAALHIRGTAKNTIAWPSSYSVNDAINKNKVDFHSNGDAPKMGIAGLMVTEGKLVLGEDGGTTFINQNYDTQIGGWTTDEPGKETSGILEIRGGENIFQSWVSVGKQNGTTVTAPEATRSSLLIYDGRTVMSNSLCFGRNKLGYSVYPMNSAPEFALHGGSLSILKDLCLADDRGTATSFLVDGGALTVRGGTVAGRCSGGCSAEMVIRDSGRVTLWDLYNVNGATLRLHVLAGGLFAAHSIYNTKGDFRILLDGGVIQTRVWKSSSGIANSLTRVEVGEKGAIFEENGDGGVWSVSAPLVHQEILGGTSDGGVAIRRNSGATASVSFQEVNTYTGPTVIESGALEMGGKGLLPVGTHLDIASGAAFFATNQNQRVSMLTIGSSDQFQPVSLGFAKGTSLICDGAFLLPQGTDTGIKIFLYEKAGSVGGLVTPGRYSVLTLPSLYAESLKKVRFSLANPVSGVLCQFVTESSGSTVSLIAAVETGASLSGAWSNPSGGNWSDAANWQSGVPVNVMGQIAQFPVDAMEEGTVVHLDSDVMVGGLTFSGANGYTLTGGGLALNNGADSIAIVNHTATNRIQSSLSLAGDVKIQTAKGGAVRFGGAISGQDNLIVNSHLSTGGGEVSFTDLAEFSGGLSIRSGRVVVPSLGFVSHAGDLEIGAGTVSYTGTGETIPGLTLNAGSGKAAQLDILHDSLPSHSNIKRVHPYPLLQKNNSIFFFNAISFFHFYVYTF